MATGSFGWKGSPQGARLRRAHASDQREGGAESPLGLRSAAARFALRIQQRQCRDGALAGAIPSYAPVYPGGLSVRSSLGRALTKGFPYGRNHFRPAVF